VSIATKNYAKEKTYNTDVVCATKNRGNLRQKRVAIAKKIYVKTKFRMHMLYVWHKTIENCDKILLLLPQLFNIKIDFRQTIVDIVTCPLSLKKKIHEIWYYHNTL
jgi:hypothetical protein